MKVPNKEDKTIDAEGTFGTLTDLYRYASGQMGLSACTPLWNAGWVKPQGAGPSEDGYYGTYCMDLYTTSKGSDFIEMYFEPPEGEIVDYLTIAAKDPITE